MVFKKAQETYDISCYVKIKSIEILFYFWGKMASSHDSSRRMHPVLEECEGGLAAAVWTCPAIHSEQAKTGAKTASFSPVSHTLIHTHTGKVASNKHVDTTRL